MPITFTARRADDPGPQSPQTMVRRVFTVKAVWVLCALVALNGFLLAAGVGYALPRPLADYVFGPRVVRAEVVVREPTGLVVKRIDRGRIRSVSDASLTLLEADNSLVTIPLAPTTRVLLGNGRQIPISALRRGMRAETERIGDGPATVVRAARR